MARTATAFTERQYGHGIMETVTETDTDERKRKAGNQALHWKERIAHTNLYQSLRDFTEVKLELDNGKATIGPVFFRHSPIFAVSVPENFFASNGMPFCPVFHDPIRFCPDFRILKK